MVPNVPGSTGPVETIVVSPTIGVPPVVVVVVVVVPPVVVVVPPGFTAVTPAVLAACRPLMFRLVARPFTVSAV